MKNPLIPMGAITTSMTKEQIKEMMTAYKEAGIEQYLFYARGGCDIEFMSDEWLDLCENIVNEAEAQGIDIWLYDEYDCPSGTCHGKLFEKHPEYKAEAVRIENGKYEILHGEGYLPMVDVTNPAAVDEFIKMTYEKLRARLGDRFGSVIKGVFSDEPSFCFDPSKPCRTYPYSDGIENEYKEKFGGDLFGGLVSDDADCLENYFSLLGEKFRRSYIEKIASWCAERGIVFTGHLFEEHDVKNAVLSNGNVIRAMRAFGMPGMDEIRTEIGEGTEWITLGSIQAARRGKSGALAELFAFGPCDMPPARLLQMIDLTALFGVDHYVMAVSPADARGSAVKTDWLHPTNYMQPHFRVFPELAKHAKKAAALASKEAEYDFAIVYPAAVAARNVYKETNEVTDKLRKLIWKLVQNGYCWTFIDEDEEPPRGAKVIKYDTDFSDISDTEKRVEVFDENMDPIRDVIVRRYADGTFCVLDISDKYEPRRIIIQNGSERIRTLLGARELFVSSDERKSLAEISTLDGELSYEIFAPDTRRCVFSAESLEYTFTAEAPLDIKLCVRGFGYGGSVTLDGAPAAAENACLSLPDGYKTLYGESDTVRIGAGEHRVRISEYAGRSEPFLPAVIITGAFSVRGDALSALSRKVTVGGGDDGLSGYVGKIRFAKTGVKIPDHDGAIYIEIDSGERPISVYLNGTLLGTAVCNPFSFRVPDGLRGTEATLEIDEYTSIGPLFGERDRVLAGVSESRVLYKYFPHGYENHAIKAIRFMKEEN